MKRLGIIAEDHISIMSSIAGIPEIISLVCECADHPTLALMARSSRILHEAAIQVLWRILPDLFPLIRCFPEDAWTLVQQDLYRSVVDITRPLSSKDWTSFLKHSALVRMLGYRPGGIPPSWYRPFASHCGSGIISLSHNVWDKLCLCRPALLLFPTLRALHWDSLHLPTIHLAPFLLHIGDCMREIVIEDHMPQQDPANMLVTVHRTIVNRFPHLHHLHVHQSQLGPQLWLTIQDSLADLVRSLTSLVSFTWLGMPMSETVLVALARSETLSSLAFNLSSDAMRPRDAALSTINRPFRRLRYLKTYGTMQAHHIFSNTVHLLTVLEVCMKLSEALLPLTMSFTAFSTSLQQQFCSSTLTVLKIDFSRPPMAITGEEFEATVLRSDDLRPLLAFTCLESFTLISLGPLSLDDTFILEMAAAWPALCTLTLNCSECHFSLHTSWPDSSDFTLPSLRVLAPFASRCTNLQDLSLCLNAACWRDNEDFMRDVELGGAYAELIRGHNQCQLTTFCANYSPITSPESVIMFLSCVFPKLARVRSYSTSGSYWSDEKRYNAWQTVDNYFALRRPRQPDDDSFSRMNRLS
ncbi:hypothetical protein GY45DRAFT_702553 [Cubamyces sp. BRFM 1775]|nr:hypothetical protein GY45DRAFT_702553 [Cubamyces sp. BRFM 1775]